MKTREMLERSNQSDRSLSTLKKTESSMVGSVVQQKEETDPGMGNQTGDTQT